MKKSLSKKITLHSETIRNLSDAQLDKPVGAGASAGSPCTPVSELSCHPKCTR